MSSSEECSSPMKLFLLGLVFGIAAGGIGVYVWQQRESQRRLDRLDSETAKALKGGQDLAGALLSASNPAASSANLDDRIRKLGDDCVEDLRVDRLLSVYRLTTKAYQQKVSREQFDELVHKTAKLRSITLVPAQRESKVRESADSKGYEYYCTANLINYSGVVNVALTFVESDGDWRIDEIELRQDS
jgi:hypothetical protein